MSATVELACPGARVRLAPGIGGAIAAFRCGDADVLRPSPDAALAAGDVRALACYPLVPYSNRIADARLTFAGRQYVLARNFGDHPHAIHGVGWQRPWSVVDRQAGDALLELRHAAADADERAAWPWPFVATQRFSLRPHAGGATLVVRLALRNVGPDAFPFGLGWHPYFPRVPGTRLGFHAESVWLNGPTQLPKTRTAIPSAWRFDPPAPVAAVLDQVFNGWDGAATLDQPGGPHLNLAADRACGHLVVYAPEDRHFLAVEPVTHETDAFNRSAAGAADTGTRVLRPGGAFSCTMRLIVHAHS